MPSSAPYPQKHDETTDAEGMDSDEGDDYDTFDDDDILTVPVESNSVLESLQKQACFPSFYFDTSLKSYQNFRRHRRYGIQTRLYPSLGRQFCPFNFSSCDISGQSCPTSCTHGLGSSTVGFFPASNAPYFRFSWTLPRA